LSLLLFNIISEFVARAVREEEEIQIGKKISGQIIPICRGHGLLPKRS
jgi:hypothetical protein